MPMINMDKIIRNEERRYRAMVKRTRAERWEERAIPHWVYIITESSEGPLKIGIARNPEQRLSNLQIGNPRALLLAHTFAVGSRERAEQIERNYHRALGAYALRGEWFDCGVEEAIKHLSDVKIASGLWVGS